MLWILSLILFLQPDAPWDSTYVTTARAMADVVAEEPPLFDGDTDKSRTTTALVATAFLESRYVERRIMRLS